MDDVPLAGLAAQLSLQRGRRVGILVGLYLGARLFRRRLGRLRRNVGVGLVDHVNRRSRVSGVFWLARSVAVEGRHRSSSLVSCVSSVYYPNTSMTSRARPRSITPIRVTMNTRKTSTTEV
ncbi:Uncharacterised protein [Mycobacteroides abscessus subsp. abscessus]|nr:Uncharacterised protein [Mycobacteroides abscessus subsp. abscessus]